MIRGRDFYAIWNEDEQIWSTDEYDVQHLVDRDVMEQREIIAKERQVKVRARLLSNYSSRVWAEFKSYVNNLSDNAKQLDMSITFQDTITKKSTYASKRVPYNLSDEPCPSWHELIGTLYTPEERAKLEWAIGSIFAGDSKTIQKFIVLYGEAGAGKSTILNVIQKLFKGYYTTFEAKELGGSRNTFSTEVFKSNPLVAIQHDGDLSNIEDNTKLNSIISHEQMTLNEKYKPSYMAQINAFLFMATNKPVKITDAKSGIIRRLIDVKPSGKTIPTHHYHALVSKIDFELGAIGQHCLNTYQAMGKNYYEQYKPLDMIYQTDVFFNFVESYYHSFKEEDGVQLTRAYTMYKEYCEEATITYKLSRHKFRDELKNYFDTFDRMTRVDGKQVRSYYTGFLKEKFLYSTEEDEYEEPYSLVIEEKESLLDDYAEFYPSQYATSSGTPIYKWAEVETTLSDIKTSRLHYVLLPEKHIVIDFDLKNEEGEKDLELNLEAASNWPATYSELSKSGGGIHLHYIYEGDPLMLEREYAEDIEIKVFNGKSSLRRKLTKCNNTEIAKISSGLPMKGEKKNVIDFKAVQNEKNLRKLIKRNLNKEIHPGTKPSVDFIKKILDDAYADGLNYDVSDMACAILSFANNSTHQASTCIKLVGEMLFKSDDPSAITDTAYGEEEIIFFDVEVFPNLFVLVWNRDSSDKYIKMINPTPEAIGEILRSKIVGFNNRRYDNHILYARYLGYTLEQLYNTSQKIINNERTALFAEAYGMSYTDIYDYSSKKQSLKKWEIELGIHHQELGMPWDEPVDEKDFQKVADYCVNDVKATKAVFHATKQDFVARKILAELSGMTVNDKTQNHAARIIFGNNKKPQSSFVYTDLSEQFEGYKYEAGKSTYKGIEPGEGGYVYAQPDMHGNVALLDVASMHPNSAIMMNVFGKYTENYKEILDARMAIKHGEYDEAKKMLGGILEKYLKKVEDASDLSYALKIVINIVYGMTSANYENPFRDPRNVDNIVAKMGALFMIDLQKAVADEGYKVIHIKTDSIKIADADKKIIDFVFNFGKEYGYDFEHEATYDKLCLVNKAVYIAKDNDDDHWEAVGAQFAEPYVFKTLFSKEELVFNDFCVTKSTRSSLHLDMNEKLPEGEHDYHFIGKTGSFCPIKEGNGGGELLRFKDDKYYAVGGTKGYRFLEAEMVEALEKEESINTEYFKVMADKAREAIEAYGDFEWFIGDDKYDVDDNKIWPFY